MRSCDLVNIEVIIIKKSCALDSQADKHVASIADDHWVGFFVALAKA